jgi:protein phosphatase 1G
MGNETDNVNRANTEKATYDKTVSKMKIGVCEMQGWRRTMEDAAIVLPNFDKKTSLFGVLDGHGGSIISEFVSVNFKNVLVRTNSYKKGNYEQALTETFLIMDELLMNGKVNNFISTTHNSKEKQKETKQNEFLYQKDSIVKLRFETGIYYFDLDDINLFNECEGTIVTVFKEKFKNKNKVNNYEMNSTTDDSGLGQSKVSKIDIELVKEEEKNSKNLKMEDIFFEKSGKQNISLNKLDSFEDVFDVYKYQLNFEPKKNIQLKLTQKISSKIITSSENLIGNQMGTTANIMLIKNGVIYIANVGDSLSVMYKNKKAYNLNREHQLILESEKERVLKSGATINGYRINGMLNLTRAIGDLQFKTNSNLKKHEQSVIAVPEITKIEDTEGIDFIIMGCDGVWDCVKRQMVCDFIDKEINENPGKNLSEILIKIFDRCVSPVWGVVLGTDNMSCIIIQFLNNNNNNEITSDNIRIQKVDINFKANNNEDKENNIKN